MTVKTGATSLLMVVKKGATSLFMVVKKGATSLFIASILFTVLRKEQQQLT